MLRYPRLRKNSRFSGLFPKVIQSSFKPTKHFKCKNGGLIISVVLKENSKNIDMKVTVNNSH